MDIHIHGKPVYRRVPLVQCIMRSLNRAVRLLADIRRVSEYRYRFGIVWWLVRYTQPNALLFSLAISTETRRDRTPTADPPRVRQKLPRWSLLGRDIPWPSVFGPVAGAHVAVDGGSSWQPRITHGGRRTSSLLRFASKTSTNIAGSCQKRNQSISIFTSGTDLISLLILLSLSLLSLLFFFFFFFLSRRPKKPKAPSSQIGSEWNFACHGQSLSCLGVQWLSVGIVIERSLVRLPPGALLSQLGQLSLPSLRGS